MADPVEPSPRLRRWVAARDCRLIWRSWDPGEYVVYSPASGDTHLINEVTAEVLRQLERAELGFADLVRQVARSLGTELEPQTEDYVAKLLVHLDEIGLVESRP